MSEQHTPQGLHALIDGAGASVQRQQDEALAAAASQARPSPTKRVMAVALLTAFVAIAVLQVPRILEPLGNPDPTQDDAVAAADLDHLASLIEAHQRAQGRYPATLDQLQLSPELASLIAAHKIDYRLTGQSFRLEWALPGRVATHDADSGATLFAKSTTTH